MEGDERSDVRPIRFRDKFEDLYIRVIRLDTKFSMFDERCQAQCGIVKDMHKAMFENDHGVGIVPKVRVLWRVFSWGLATLGFVGASVVIGVVVYAMTH